MRTAKCEPLTANRGREPLGGNNRNGILLLPSQFAVGNLPDLRKRKLYLLVDLVRGAGELRDGRELAGVRAGVPATLDSERLV